MRDALQSIRVNKRLYSFLTTDILILCLIGKNAQLKAHLFMEDP